MLLSFCSLIKSQYTFVKSLRSLYCNINLMTKIQKMDERIVWIDLEMTGLQVEKDKIMEISALVTDGNLNIIAEGPNIIIGVEKEILDHMDEWCIKYHGESGLTSACLKSIIKLEEAEATILEFIQKHVEAGRSLLAGNSIHRDRQFLEWYMPKFIDYLHYRMIDVSTIKELCRRWYPKEFAEAPKKKKVHRTLDDIKESIEELKYYREQIFK